MTEPIEEEKTEKSKFKVTKISEKKEFIAFNFYFFVVTCKETEKEV